MGAPNDPRYWRASEDRRPAPSGPESEETSAAGPGIKGPPGPSSPLSPVSTVEFSDFGLVDQTQPLERAVAALSWWRTIETVWLGLTRASLAERAVDEGWMPDPLSAYCWRCATSVGAHEAIAEGCPACRERRLPWSRAVRLGEYTGLVREVVHEVKFTAWRRLGMDAGRLLGDQLLPLLERVDRNNVVIVPVPSTFRRRMARGIDHTLVLSRGVRLVTGAPIARALQRRHRPSQVGLPMTERRQNVSGSMRLRRGTNLAGKLVIVLDDVRTTGATMTEACRALTRGIEPGSRPSEIWTAVLGVAAEAKRATT
jgi:predicted amidophosphoribosyltransferase